jgi:hypothetical protein
MELLNETAREEINPKIRDLEQIELTNGNNTTEETYKLLLINYILDNQP